MTTIEEKRVYGARTGATEVYVAAGIGVVSVEVSGARVGGFGVVHRCTARDVAVAGGRIAVATDEDVLLLERADAEGEARDGEDREATPAEFGPAVAVDYDDGDLVGAAEDGRVARWGDGDWTTLGRVEEPRAVDGGLVAAADGVHRIAGDDLVPAGLSDVRDVAGRGRPLAATGEGLYELGNGWMDALDGAFAVAATDGDDRAHAATDAALYERAEREGWTRIDVPGEERVADVDYAPRTVAVTADGTFLVAGADGWRTQSLGVRDVAGLAAGK